MMLGLRVKSKIYYWKESALTQGQHLACLSNRKSKILCKAYVIYNTFYVTGAFTSGNKFQSLINNITNISNVHLWMFDNQDVGGSSGIWYTQWLHWQMGFSVKVEPCPSCTPPDCGNKTCYFGTCGADGDCQCLRGYSGTNCENSKWNCNVILWNSLKEHCSTEISKFCLLHFHVMSPNATKYIIVIG